ncbi:acyl-CoA dehydrogenase [Mycobacterium sp.]|uniref:acyl-CoA dehydrogenase n=1 Tax=Mycobacterium sp. TaxID=1785 RepID=UPI002B96CB1A|nr:acyl-CoA dehydrogenase [Mycobacterium sp.]HME47770.1 acyl-CoA dehydrogenase [Mycobacterium sp.]
MTVTLVNQWLSSGALNLPLPGAGATAERWRRLAGLTEIDVVAGRLAEAHTDAVAILAELGGPEPEPDELWGVWAAEPPEARLAASGVGDHVLLDGTKPWCSGAALCARALVTARLNDGRRALFAVHLSDERVQPLEPTWRNPGMAGSDTRSVKFAGAPAVQVGRPGDYLERPGFWFGAIGVAACWLGAARAVAAPLYRRAAGTSVDPHTLAHLGAVDAALTAAQATLAWAAAHVDGDPLNSSGLAELVARRTRAVAEAAADEAIVRTGRSLGPGPLCLDGDHARRVADLTVYLRQSHAERDLEALGTQAAADHERR